jgi:hypothetical protein
MTRYAKNEQGGVRDFHGFVTRSPDNGDKATTATTFFPFRRRASRARREEVGGGSGKSKQKYKEVTGTQQQKSFRTR